MSVALRNLSLIIVFIYFFWIFFMIRKKKFTIKNSLLWLFAGTVMLVIILFPVIIEKLSQFFGVEIPSNGLFAMCIFFIVLILIYLTAMVSEISEKLKVLTQNIGILEKKTRELEEKINANKE